MKKREEEITRVKSVIDNDRLNFNKDFNKLFGIDLNTLLEEYFILKNQPCVEIIKRGKDFLLVINVSIDSFKTFSSVKN